MVQWPARFFLEDKVIKPATICAIYKGGFCIRYDQAIGIGKVLHFEFRATLANEDHRIRLKACIDYCLLRENEVEIDLRITVIGREDNHRLANILQAISEAR